MKRIYLPTIGSARVETVSGGQLRPSDAPANESTDDTVSHSTSTASDMLTPFRLWILTDGNTERLAYVQRRMETSEGRTRPVYRITDASGFDEVKPDEWKRMKAGALRTDAMAEAGPEGVQLIKLARKGRIPFRDAVARIDQIDYSHV